MIAVVVVMALLGTATWLGLGLAPFRKAATAGQRYFRPPTVAVVGDSITALSRQSIINSMTQAGYQPTVEAVIGIKMAQAAPAIDYLAQQHPADWVIELGTNDAGTGNSMWPEPFLAEWQQVKSSGCVIYVSVSLHAGPIAAQIDSSLGGLAREHANVHVLDWGSLEYDNPVWLEPDMIHPTPAGQVELATLETQELRRYC